jgi:hypothetical protein
LARFAPGDVVEFRHSKRHGLSPSCTISAQHQERMTVDHGLAGSFTVDQGLATAVAAVIAAFVSIVTLIVSAVAAGRSEIRAAHREVLAPYLETLSESLYTIVAAVVVMRKRSLGNQEVGEWQTRAKEAGKRVDDTRRKVRYFLPGLEEALRQLVLASDHVATITPIPGDHADKLVRGYQRLSGRVDVAIRASYRKGMPPGIYRRWRVGRAAAAVAKLWDRRPTR